MKVRLEIINDDGTKRASAEFEYADRHGLEAFLDIYSDETRNITEPSSNSFNTVSGTPRTPNYPATNPVSTTPVNVAEQNAYQPQFVQQQTPVNTQQPVQQAHISQYPSQQYAQMPAQQAQMPAPPVLPQTQQPGQAYVQPQPWQPPVSNTNTISDHQLPPQYNQPNLPPVGVQQYGYGQPVQPISSTVRQTMNPNQQMQSAVSPTNLPVQSVPGQAPAPRKVPSLHNRMNDTSLTINERLELFLKYEYPRIWFSSQDIQKHYERIYGEIKQSTVSTYLSRMFRKNILARRGNRTQREYRYIADEIEQESDAVMGQMSEMPLDHRFQY
ncbi:hypothetical protein [Methanolobus bombayensis]|uniref:hypothetical protein n=1 Tax=Methanolobus bombayensis TaxID=38023 RepID=UPI001AEB4D87|nr:hypothetical protein [Methanolobus bombayensis]MBP1908231.1 hypothetical protein [Methanolobus bombayensis]